MVYTGEFPTAGEYTIYSPGGAFDLKDYYGTNIHTYMAVVTINVGLIQVHPNYVPAIRYTSIKIPTPQNMLFEMFQACFGTTHVYSGTLVSQ